MQRNGTLLFELASVHSEPPARSQRHPGHSLTLYELGPDAVSAIEWLD
jgi:hypothetical protein